MAGVPATTTAPPKLVVAGVKVAPSTLTTASWAVRDGDDTSAHTLELEVVAVVSHDLAPVERELALVAVQGGHDDTNSGGGAEVRDVPVGAADKPAPPADVAGVGGPHRKDKSRALRWRPPWRRVRSRSAPPNRAGRTPRTPRPCPRRSTPGWRGAATARRRSSCAS